MARFTAVLLLSLGGCGGEDSGTLFRANLESGNPDSFPEFSTEVTGADPVTIRTCSKDPTPQVFDDERTLCLHLTLDGAGLKAAGSSATLRIQGEAQLTDPGGPTPPTFAGAAGNSPVVLAAWATVGCYSMRRAGPLPQQLDGHLELKKNSEDRLEARVELTASGELSVADCGRVTSADFQFTFDEPRH